MPRMLIRAGIVVALLVAPALALAAATDVTLTTDTVLSVNGTTLNVSGSSAVIESITVNSGNFSVTMLSGSTFQVTAPGRESLAYDTNTGLASVICNGSQSILSYAPSSTVTVTITPGALCQGGGGGGGSSGSSSSGGSATVSTPAVTTPAITTIPAVTTPAITTPAVITALTTNGSIIKTAVHVFKSNLTVGSRGSEVKALQQFLNAHGYIVAKKGAGSLGKETTMFGQGTKAALIKYQKAKGIKPASGYFGANTRKAVNAEK